jgi:hypothetical protein
MACISYKVPVGRWRVASHAGSVDVATYAASDDAVEDSRRRARADHAGYVTQLRIHFWGM